MTISAISFCPLPPPAIPESALLELAELAVRGVLEAYEDVILEDLVIEDSDGSVAVTNLLRLPELRDKLAELAR